MIIPLLSFIEYFAYGSAIGELLNQRNWPVFWVLLAGVLVGQFKRFLKFKQDIK